MTTHLSHPRLEVSHTEGRTTVRFTVRTGLCAQNIEAIGRQLSDLVERDAPTHLLLDLGNVDYLTSAALGKMVVLHGRLRDRGGRLTVENAGPLVCEILAITRLDRVLDVRSEPEGVLP